MSGVKLISSLQTTGCPDFCLQNRKFKQVFIYAFSVLQLCTHLFVKTVSGDTCRVEKMPIDRGSIMSSRYPSPYDSQAACVHWLIQTTGRYDTITISFKDLDLPEGIDGNCTNNYLQIGPFPYRIYCGSTLPGPYISHNGTVFINFYTDGSNTFHRGFSLIYITGAVPSKIPCKEDEFMCANGKCIYKMWRCNKQFECEDNSDELGCIVNGDCRKQLTGNSGYITSPNFPYDYDNNLECQWNIHVPYIDAKIQLRFQGHFNIQNNPDTDYVLVYDGPDKTYKLIGTYNGRDKPPAVIESTTNNLLVVFHTDANTQEQGFNATFQMKGFCLENQEACGFGENDCYETVRKCDGRLDCPESGGDERGCKQCKLDEFSCGATTSQCYLPSEKCNGVAKCSNMADEIFCSSIECGSHNGTFLCQNGHCIYERWLCDNRDDCSDLSDEVDCEGSTRRVIIAAIAGSMTCGILLVILLGCACKLYHLRVMERNGGPHHSTPMSRLYAQFMQRRAPPPYHEAMATSRPYDEVQREILENSGNHNHGSHRGQHRSLRSHQNGNERTNVPVDCPTVALSVGDDDILEVPCTEVNRITSELMSPTSRLVQSSGSEDSDTASNDISIQLSGASGDAVVAHWSRTSPCKTSSDQESLSGEISNQCNSLQRGNNQHQMDDTFSIETASTSINSDEIPFDTDRSNRPKLDGQLTGKNAQNISMGSVPVSPADQHLTSSQNRRQSDSSDSSLISEDLFDPVINDQASLLHS
ncbi:hypothetical protein ACJMK2_010279 [Sinanodonta woodiana]|uniref:CUB domain-containing protein n=1 Tax=Sinanodonta woodiana TaxID=1069815 RepID=A0ABD3VG46_SINWO